MKKKLLSTILSAVLLIVSLSPFTAFADSVNTVRTAENLALNSTASQTFKYGYPDGTYNSRVSDTEKYYKFTAPSTDYYEFQITGFENTEYIDGKDAVDGIYVFLRDSSEKSVGSISVNSVSYVCKKAFNLTKGQTYYLDINTYLYNTKSYKAKEYGYAEQTLKVSVKKHTHNMKVSQQTTYYTYYECEFCDYRYSKEKACKHSKTKKTVTKKATFWAAGKCNVYCTDCGKTVKTDQKVKKKAVKISSAKAGKKSAKVSWKKVSGATGYEIQYSTNSNFKSAKTYKVKKGSATFSTINKLKKGKNYYFRVKAVKGKKSSSWSKSKNCKIK